jgi:MerR family transcriptional regulator, copper efflux regulator
MFDAAENQATTAGPYIGQDKPAILLKISAITARDAPIMYIGELAKLTGSSPKAIRHYEALGLLGQVRRVGVYRVYLPRDVLLVNLIKQAQALGFKLSELKFLEGHQGNPDWEQLDELIGAKRQSIAGEIKRLQQLALQLEEVRREIHACLDLQERRDLTLASGLTLPLGADFTVLLQHSLEGSKPCERKPWSYSATRHRAVFAPLSRRPMRMPRNKPARKCGICVLGNCFSIRSCMMGMRKYSRWSRTSLRRRKRSPGPSTWCLCIRSGGVRCRR